MNVQGIVTITGANPTTGGVVVSGNVGPGAPHAHANVAISARPQGSTGAFSQVGAVALTSAQSSYAIGAKLGPGKWQIEATFADPGQVLAGTSAAVNVTVPSSSSPAPGSTTVHFAHVSVKNGAVTVTGTVKPAPTATGAFVGLLAAHTTKLKVSSTKKASAAAAALPRRAKVAVGKGKTTFTIHARLTRGFRWKLELEYVARPSKTSYSALRTITVR
jgi:LysM repeat protein